MNDTNLKLKQKILMKCDEGQHNHLKNRHKKNKIKILN